MNTEEDKPIEDPVAFMKGQQDCIDGIIHKDRSESYNRGYAAQYELDECRSAGQFN